MFRFLPKNEKQELDRAREICLKSNYESISRMEVYLLMPQSSALRQQ